MSECYLQPKPIKKPKHRQYRCLSLWAQHETQETASLIITYLSVCPPQGPPVTIADAPHWQARNTHANSNTVRGKKSSTIMSVTCVGIQTHPQGGITMTTSSGGKAKVYYSIFGFQLASVAVRLAEVYIHICTNGQFSIQCLQLYVCWMWEETSRSPVWSNGENIYWIVSQRQTSLSKFVCLPASTVDILWLAENVCTQTGRCRNYI